MAEHSASVTIHAPVHQVYSLFTHFNDFPKFMRFVKEVTYYDDRRTHWVVHVLKDYKWDAVNEDWIENQQVGWRSTSGLKNSGKVKFRALGPQRTIVDVYIYYEPPTGPLGKLGDTLGVNSHFERILREDLQHFAKMVEQAPAGALDPMSSHYLFHPSSAVAAHAITPRQNEAMSRDPRMSPEALAQRQTRIAEELAARTTQQQEEEAKRRQAEEELRTQQEQQMQIELEAKRRLQEQRAREAELARAAQTRRKADPVHDTLGGRNASRDRTPFGDKDGLRVRYPRYEQSPMKARYPLKAPDPTTGPLEESKLESPWYFAIRGTPAPRSEPEQ